jgi:glutamate 5-kinase
LTRDDGSLALSRLFALIEAAAEARRAGRDVLIVTSGAVGLGRDALGLRDTPIEVGERQACAAIGQSRLMGLYQEGFARLGLLCAQVALDLARARRRAGDQRERRGSDRRAGRQLWYE